MRVFLIQKSEFACSPCVFVCVCAAVLFRFVSDHKQICCIAEPVSLSCFLVCMCVCVWTWNRLVAGMGWDRLQQLHNLKVFCRFIKKGWTGFSIENFNILSTLIFIRHTCDFYVFQIMKVVTFLSWFELNPKFDPSWKRRVNEKQWISFRMN